MFELCKQYLFEAAKTIQVEVGFALLQVHRKDQSREAKVMVAMEVADKNMIDFVYAESILRESQLRSLTAVDEKMPILNSEILRRRKSAVSRQRSTGAEDGELE